MTHYLDELNDVQRAAVTATEGPVLVIAGPGSGKTRVLTYRIAYLLEKGVEPWRILALTFTNKAAREMTERIERVVGQRARQVWAGTFHSIFARILRAEAARIGYPSSFSIYDTDDTTNLLRTIIVKEMGLDPQQYNPAVIRSRISLAKSNLLTPALYRSNPQMMEQDRLARRPFTVDIYERYVARCKRAGAMDFDDLLLQMHHLLRQHPDVADKYRQRFQYLHVDEFQDTNFLQYAILLLLTKYPDSPENLFVVGDDAQSIYAFRGATIDNILDFSKDFIQLKTFKLEQNYRSTHHIVSAANEIIAHNQRQLPKKIWTNRQDSHHKIRLLRCLTDDDEARRVVDLILEQKNRFHLRNGDIAILYRTNAQSRKFEEQLRRQDLPYRVFGGLSFYQRKEVKDLMAYLRLTVNPYDEEALVRIINYPARGISEATVDKIRQHAIANNLPLWDATLTADLPERARKAVLNFRALVESWQRRAQVESAYTLAADIYRQSGLLDELKSARGTEEGLSRLQNANAVLDAIGEFTDRAEVLLLNEEEEQTSDASLAAYLQTVTLLTDADLAHDSPDYITLMSAHAAKGLEFRSVFITGMEETLFPSFFALENPGGIDEERRLFYVAVTRAKEFLTISYAGLRYRNGRPVESTPSRFLSEISREHYEDIGGIGSRRVSVETPARASISGNFTKQRVSAAYPQTSAYMADDFKPSPLEAIVPGVRVRHLKFGEGVVKSVEGARENRVASIVFNNDEVPERRLVLRFAKLMVLD
ncbi:MAG: UvrD-helicase domain-containing protein [Saprospiraceae bacterium]|nr:UvrD-helicase domain-containing protein [Saprospiraceae bacterium]MDW8483479.1 UvrD-helicase domain-containing protein [Saprospiraceae bacterium]